MPCEDFLLWLWISVFQLSVFFHLHQTVSLCMLLERETSFLVFGEWICTNQISCPRSDSVHVNAYFVLPAVSFPISLNYCIWAVNTWHQGEYFYLHFKMPNSKQLGVHNCSAPVILSMECAGKWETCWRETEQASMCLSKGVTEHDRGWGKGVG